jgi:hypothetical protein
MSKPICTIECEDCGKFPVMNNDSLSIFLIDKDFFAMTRCVFCDRAIKDYLDKETAIKLFWENIKIFNFNTGEQILDQRDFNLI